MKYEENVCITERDGNFKTCYGIVFLVSDLSVIYFLTAEHAVEMGCAFAPLSSVLCAFGLWD